MENERICVNGHRYTKSSDCPTCPRCEEQKKPTAGWKVGLAAPALRALQQANINTLMDLQHWSKEELAKLHGMGPKAIARIETVCKQEGTGFRNDDRPL
jgi:DNA uptake protein ComE-like DNA-binding protein